MSIKALLEKAQHQVLKAHTVAQIEQLRLDYLGKKGLLNQHLKQIGKLPKEQRKAFAEEANQAKQSLLTLLAESKQRLYVSELRASLANQKIDISLPGMPLNRGGIHPITQTIWRIEDIFASAGYVVAEGPEIEDDFHNFSALNIASNHPARAMHDSFYFNADLVLRTHTSSVQIRALEKAKLPLKIIAPGRVYRCDSDQTHTPMFHQVEGLLVDRDVCFADLLQLLTKFLKTFFNDETLKVRFRPSYFPFTEPSCEVDIAAQDSDHWLEVLGCGLVHPKVLSNVDVDPQQWSGFAFGMGVERLAMLRHGVQDLRQFFANDLRFLAQFN